MKPGTSAMKIALVLFTVVLISSCSHKNLSLFFDLPPQQDEELQEERQPNVEISVDEAGIPRMTPVAGPIDNNRPRPAIEGILDWDEAMELLPKDATGQVDWIAALDEGVIRPRALNSTLLQAEIFKLDFFLKGANPMFDAWFPHSVHTAIIACDSCHGDIFRYRDNEMSMAKINQGEYCGACHGKVGFPATACKRCHTSMP